MKFRGCTLVATGLMCLGAVAPLAGCSDYSQTAGSDTTHGRDSRVARAHDTIQRFKARDASIDRFFRTAYGYVVFPEITKGGAGIGAAHGDHGVVFERGQVIGFAEMTQVTVGAQLGGQDFAEIIFFRDRADLEDFKRNNFEFAANASAIAVESGAAASSDYSNGVAVFTLPKSGLMFEAAIGGQKFEYFPMRMSS